MRILLLNGPNLATLGRREVEIYGSMTLAEIVEAARAHALERGSMIEAFQSTTRERSSTGWSSSTMTR